jgi:hypothetical protein
MGMERLARLENDLDPDDPELIPPPVDGLDEDVLPSEDDEGG